MCVSFIHTPPILPSTHTAQLQALDADQLPVVDQDSSSSHNKKSRAPSSSNVHASPLARGSGVVAHEGSSCIPDMGGNVSPSCGGMSASFGTPAATPFSLGASPATPFGTVEAHNAALEGEPEPQSVSMSCAAAAAVAAVDEERRLESVIATAGQSQGRGEEEGGASGGHPHLRINTGRGREVWGSGEEGMGEVRCTLGLSGDFPDRENGKEGQGHDGEEGRSSSRVLGAAQARAADFEGVIVGAGGDRNGSSGGVSPLASPGICSTPLQVGAGGFAVPEVGQYAQVKDGGQTGLSTWQMQRARTIEASRASVPEMLLRAHKVQQQEMGSSSGGSSSIRSPSQYAAGHALRLQIDAFEQKYAAMQAAQLQQQQQQVADEPASYRRNSSNSSGNHQRSGSDTLIGLRYVQQQQQQQQQPWQQRQAQRQAQQAARRVSEGGGACGFDDEEEGGLTPQVSAGVLSPCRVCV